MAAAYADLEEVAADGSVDDILALAERYPHIDVSIYSTAMTKAYESGDIERAKKIANSYPVILKVAKCFRSRSSALRQYLN